MRDGARSNRARSWSIGIRSLDARGPPPAPSLADFAGLGQRALDVLDLHGGCGHGEAGSDCLWRRAFPPSRVMHPSALRRDLAQPWRRRAARRVSKGGSSERSCRLSLYRSPEGRYRKACGSWRTYPATSAILALTSLRMSVAGRPARAENRTVPWLVLYPDRSALSVITVSPLMG